jgi:hypothetical protein
VKEALLVSYYQATPVRLIEPTGEQHEFPSAKAAAKFLSVASSKGPVLGGGSS